MIAISEGVRGVGVVIFFLFLCLFFLAGEMWVVGYDSEMFFFTTSFRRAEEVRRIVGRYLGRKVQA